MLAELQYKNVEIKTSYVSFFTRHLNSDQSFEYNMGNIFGGLLA